MSNQYKRRKLREVENSQALEFYDPEESQQVELAPLTGSTSPPLASGTSFRRKGSSPYDDEETKMDAMDSSVFPDTGRRRSTSFKRKKFGIVGMTALASYWFGFSLLWMALPIAIMPSQVEKLGGSDKKASNLAAILSVGALSALVVAPIIGTLSDISRNPMGRRRPFMICGCILATVCLLCMAFTQNLVFYSFSFVMLSISSNLMMIPYSALVPDVVSEDQRGVASGWLGGLAMLGNLAGGIVTHDAVDHYVFPYFIIIVLHGSSLFLTVYFVEEHVPEVPPGRFTVTTCCGSFIKPFKHHDFRILFFSRFLVQMGSSSLQENLLFYLEHAIGEYTFFGSTVASNKNQALAVVSAPLLLSAMASSAVSGFLSDRYGGERKFIAYYSGAIMAGACFILGLTRDFTICLIFSAVFGTGFGAFAAIDWAMATDILPDEEEFAKDMGVWSLAVVLPNLWLPVTGAILDYFENHVLPEYHTGFTVVLLLACVYYGIGTWSIQFIRAVR